jgi:hypothetical protein
MAVPLRVPGRSGWLFAECDRTFRPRRAFSLSFSPPPLGF